VVPCFTVQQQATIWTQDWGIMWEMLLITDPYTPGILRL
jgi:hypothetical protein